VKTTSVGGIRGYDGAKKLSGRKRHLLVDTLGMVLKIRVHSADLQDRGAVPLVLEGAAEAYLVMDEIKEAGVPVIIHPTMVRPFGEVKNSTFETAGKLHEAGIPVAFQSGYEGYVPKTRVARYEAAIAAANGMGMENALYALTKGAADILGIGDRVGTLERGKRNVAEIASTAREALTEMRRLLDVLRNESAGPEHAPQPDLARLEHLLDGAPRAGLEVGSEVEGDREALSPGLELYA
jgi:hypothetical protein